MKCEASRCHRDATSLLHNHAFSRFIQLPETTMHYQLATQPPVSHTMSEHHTHARRVQPVTA